MARRSRNGAATGIAGASVLAVVLVVALAVAPGSGAGRGVDTERGIAGYSGVQLENAVLIMRAGEAAGIDEHGQTVAVMTAAGESSLRVLPYGDAAGPDSRGLFQQRDSWGPLEVRMDPTASARLFYSRLARVRGWEDMRPTLAAHAVQRNADPEHYERYWAPAQRIVAALGAGGHDDGP